MTISEQIQNEAEEMFPYEFEIGKVWRPANYQRQLDYIAGATKHAEMAIEFADWKDEYCQKMGDRWMVVYAGTGGKLFTTKELYELFLTDKNKQK